MSFQPWISPRIQIPSPNERRNAPFTASTTSVTEYVTSSSSAVCPDSRSASWSASAPVPEPDRAYLRSIRHGERPLAEVLGAITSAETRLTELRDSPALPDQPDRAWVDDWLHRSYLYFWAQRH